MTTIRPVLGLGTRRGGSNPIESSEPSISDPSRRVKGKENRSGKLDGGGGVGSVGVGKEGKNQCSIILSPPPHFPLQFSAQPASDTRHGSTSSFCACRSHLTRDGVTITTTTPPHLLPHNTEKQFLLFSFYLFPFFFCHNVDGSFLLPVCASRR